MEFILTCDPTVIIVYQDIDLIIYYQYTTEQSWLIYGKCIDVGNCYEGAQNPKPELDCPVKPEFEGCCDLRGIYL